MNQLFVPLGGPFAALAGSGYNKEGENLDRPLWRGAELSQLTNFPAVLGAVAEAEFHDWIIGVRHPLFIEGGPAPCRFLASDRQVRQDALDLADSAAQAAHQLGSRYIQFQFPWPAVRETERNDIELGWPQEEGTWAAEWSTDSLYEACRAAFDRLAAIQERESIKIVLEIDGPNRYFFEGEMYSRLFAEFGSLSLCLDTARLGLLARTHGQDPLDLCRRWLPWTRYLRLHTSGWDPSGLYWNRIPTNGLHTAERWPAVTPAADMARLVVQAQPAAAVILQGDPRLVSAAELEAAHAWAAELVRFHERKI